MKLAHDCNIPQIWAHQTNKQYRARARQQAWQVKAEILDSQILPLAWPGVRSRCNNNKYLVNKRVDASASTLTHKPSSQHPQGGWKNPWLDTQSDEFAHQEAYRYHAKPMPNNKDTTGPSMVECSYPIGAPNELLPRFLTIWWCAENG